MKTIENSGIIQTITRLAAKYEAQTGQRPNAVLIGTNLSTRFAQEVNQLGFGRVYYGTSPLPRGFINSLRIIPNAEFPNALSVAFCGDLIDVTSATIENLTPGRKTPPDDEQ